MSRDFTVGSVSFNGRTTPLYGSGVEFVPEFIRTSSDERNRYSEADLLSRIGTLDMKVQGIEAELTRLRRYAGWLQCQALVSTPEICCPGAQLEERVIALLDNESALKELAASRQENQ